MKMISFHTPELPEPLGLDLAKLRGGGSCPSQFYGETHEGLDVYVRYRGGTLRVHVANEPGDDALRDGDCILEADIGPPFDGSMSLTQFCTNFGVTVDGIVPDETDPHAHRYANLTGQMTFWKANLSQITIETARKIVGKAWSVFPNALLVKPVTNEKFKLERLELTTPERIDTLSVWLIDGPSLLTDIETSPEDYVLPSKDQLQISISFSSWQYPAPKYTSQQREAEKELERKFYVPGEKNMPKDIELATDGISLSACFPKEDQTTKNALTRLGEAIAQLLPLTSLERIDLATGDPIDVIKRPIDPVILDWCNSGEDRWVAIIREKRHSPWIGVRPATS
ncbi:hypothetical protein EDD52_1574 [Primorskyibacter sedentarius]|uniref:Uncharacterized protein n=1 Tax=Primorskyibacter sedentarius TaxID=745311 RepID=A0A4R3IIP7_9RHOB|nr:hypothetical protein [Primorskyibacter sedentarius]TCS48220.1 hypothetical protein EDD52_1574 [Primorskyibacter sedentarius]